MEFKEIVYKKLNELGIKYEIFNHKAIFSEYDAEEEIFDNDIVIGKNLFLRNDKKTKYYLISLPLNKKADLKKMAEIIEEKRFSFANEKELNEYLNIKPGSVSFLNIITASLKSDKYKEVEYIIDKELFNSKKVGFHPSDNTATVVTNPNSILKLYDEYNLKYKVIGIYEGGKNEV